MYDVSFILFPSRKANSFRFFFSIQEIIPSLKIINLELENVSYRTEAKLLMVYCHLLSKPEICSLLLQIISGLGLGQVFQRCIQRVVISNGYSYYL